MSSFEYIKPGPVIEGAEKNEIYKKRFTLIPERCTCGAVIHIIATDWSDYDFHGGYGGVVYALSCCENGHEQGHADNGSMWKNHPFYREEKK